ncbi:MAG: hypothetical protein ABJC19_10840 [Gemmatimonadota bacterium]
MAADQHRVTLAQAQGYTHAWQKGDPRGRHAWMLPREIIDEILAQPECEGIRVYAGGSPADRRLVWVGTDAKGNDLVGGTIAEECFPCPPVCQTGSPLLSEPS